jgi:uncharacterized protein
LATKKVILKTLVGSKAHGLDTPASDTDYRFVFLTPTLEILSLGFKDKGVAWEEGDGQDNTGHELLQFLELATRSNPSVLEVLAGPTIESSPEGEELKALLPYIWSSNDVFNAFTGYSHNQLKKFFDEKDSRPWKYATAMLRVLMLGIEVLEQGTLTVNVDEQEKKLGRLILSDGLSHNMILRGVKTGEYHRGQIIDWAQILKDRIKKSYAANPDTKTDLARVNDFLLKVRRSSL